MMELVPYSARGDRLISRFHAEEMLYEYVQVTLDPIRAEGVKNIIETDPKLMLEVEAIRRALAYCDTLSRIEFTPARINDIRTETTAYENFLKRTRVHEWPGGVRVGLESLFVISLVFFFALMVPWNTLINVLQENQGTVILSEVSKEHTPSEAGPDLMVAKTTSAPLPADQQASTATDKFEDEGVPQEELAAIKKPLESLTEILKTQKTQPAPLKPVAAPLPAVDKKVESRVATDREPAQASAETVTPNPAVRTGFLNKARLTLTNVQSVTPKIVETINALGGRKAGQVPLGWAKGTGSYFHFTIPEAKYVELETALKSYGKFSVVRESHARVMPDGIVRVIIDVEETAPGIKKEPEFIPDPVTNTDGSTATGDSQSTTPD